jgi:integrase
LNGDWRLPARRNKGGVDLTRPLSKAAQDILAKQPRIGAYVFGTGGRPLGGYSYFKRAFDKACGISGWTLHDLRRTSRSLMARAGVPERHAEQCLGHKIGGVEGIYNQHDYRQEMLIAYEKLATQIENIVRPQSNIVALRG